MIQEPYISNYSKLETDLKNKNPIRIEIPRKFALCGFLVALFFIIATITLSVMFLRLDTSPNACHINLPHIEDLIDYYSLSPHIEGGYFTNTYHSNISLPQDILLEDKNHTIYSSILYVLDNISVFHILKSDEIWYYHIGGPSTMIIISNEGELTSVTFGTDIINNQVMYYKVKQGNYFAVYNEKDVKYSIFTCLVSPSYSDGDEYIPTKSELLKLFPDPHLNDIIVKLARPE